ncbi:hypothetical protein CCR75_002059 [Bremia lactucae]|uniref:LYC1 C-terminal domain-containing protein n=1 Tax=Bremia lactucae TaxID=4779 RepID=A0A976IB82_BRELC|nr:hypothetical protein CCR75_002059 [Bremia lactucae]
MSKFRVVQLTHEALKVQCKVDDFEEWGAPALDRSQYLCKEELQRAMAFSQQGSIFWALVDTMEDSELVAGQTVIYCHCESHRFDCAVRHGSGEIKRGFSHHIGSVFTLPQYRNKGLASFFMKEVANQLKLLPGALVSILYSDIGPTFYDKLGWKLYPSISAILDVEHPVNANAGSNYKAELVALTLDDKLDDILKADNTRLVEELSSNRFKKQEAFAILPTRDSIEWQFCIGVHYATAHKNSELPYYCGVKIHEDAFLIWRHNFKESTLNVLRARFPEKRDNFVNVIHLLLNEAVKEARKFNLQKIAIWDPPLVLACSEVRCSIIMSFIEREDSLSSALIFYRDDSVGSSTLLPHWLANQKYAWV